MAHHYPFTVVDVFTKVPFEGNQLAIVNLVDDKALTREQRHAIVREFNFSETVFLYDLGKDADPNDPRKLEIWTPASELPFAGHPTIGTACYCGNQYGARDFALDVPAGRITATYDSASAVAEAGIPHNVHIHACRVPATAVHRSQPRLAAVAQQGAGEQDYPVVSIVKGMTFVLVNLPTVETHLAAVAVSSQRIEGIELDADWESAVTAPYFYAVLPSSAAAPNVRRLQTRMIEASSGEDPATGSAACTLCCWLSLMAGRPGPQTFELEQGVEMGRRSVIRVTVGLDASGQAVQSVKLAGSAVVTMRGVLTAP